MKKSLKLNLLASKKSHNKELEYIYIDEFQNVIACNSFSAIKTTLLEAMGNNVDGFETILSQYKKIYIHSDEYKKISNKELLKVDIVTQQGNELFLEFTEKTSKITIKATTEEFSFFDMFFKDDFFSVNCNAIESIAIDFDLLNNFNESIKSSVTKEATVLKFSSKFDKIQIKNLALKNTTFILLPVKIHDENY